MEKPKEMRAAGTFCCVSHFALESIFHLFRSSSFTFCIASTDKHFPALKIISHQEKGFKRKFLTCFYPILIFFNMMSMHFKLIFFVNQEIGIEILFKHMTNQQKQ